MKVVLISCVKKKQAGKHKARDLYISPWFKYAFRYAQSLCPDRIFVLSAKHFLVDQNTEIEYYEKMLKRGIREWASKVVTALNQETGLEKDTFIILAGEKYRRHLIRHLVNYSVPMQGLTFGRQLQWLEKHCSR